MTALGAGEYYAIAVLSNGTIDISDTQFLDMLGRRAAEFAIGAGEQKNLRLTLASVD